MVNTHWELRLSLLFPPENNPPPVLFYAQLALFKGFVWSGYAAVSRAPTMKIFASLQSVRPWPQQERGERTSWEKLYRKNDVMSGRAVCHDKSNRIGLVKWHRSNAMYENALKIHCGRAFSWQKMPGHRYRWATRRESNTSHVCQASPAAT